MVLKKVTVVNGNRARSAYLVSNLPGHIQPDWHSFQSHRNQNTNSTEAVSSAQREINNLRGKLCAVRRTALDRNKVKAKDLKAAERLLLNIEFLHYVETQSMERKMHMQYLVEQELDTALQEAERRYFIILIFAFIFVGFAIWFAFSS